MLTIPLSASRRAAYLPTIAWAWHLGTTSAGSPNTLLYPHGSTGTGEGRVPVRYRQDSEERTEALVAEGVRRVSEQEPVRIPKHVLEELESVRRYTRAEVLDIPTVRHVAMETEKPALVLWIDRHQQEYGQGLLDGFLAED